MKYPRLLLLIGLLALAALLAAPSPGQPAAAQQTDIPLSVGWNLISLPLAPADTAPAAVLTSIAGKLNSAWAYAPGAPNPWLSYDPDVPDFLNTLTAIDVSMGFWLNMKEAGTLTVSGSQPGSTEIAVSPGWNFIGYPASEAKPIADVMGTLPYNSVWAYDPGQANPWQSYDPNVPPFLNTLQQFTPNRGYALNAAAGVLTVGEPPPTSYDLIRQALDAGDIDAETALTYKIFVTFSDPRLPTKYQGDDDAVWDDPGAVEQAVATFDTLSPATQDILAPFLLPAYAPGSWQQLRAAGAGGVQAQAVLYSTIEFSPHVKVWYRQDRPQDQNVAFGLAVEVDYTIWDKLTGLMGQPKSDADQPNNGGDGRIDIILSGDPLGSFAAPYACKATSAIVTLGTGGANKYVLTHELMHVITFHFNVQTACEYPEYRWFNEATSQWSIDFVYPDSQEERVGGNWIPKCFLEHPAQPLEYRNDCHEYAAYVFLFYLHRNHDKQYVRKIWDAFAGSDSLAAVNTALAPLGGLKEVWPKFVLQNYNREPETEYRDQDNLTTAAFLEADENVSLGGAPKRTYFLRGDADHLTAFYYHYEFNDPEIQEVTFKHSLKGQPTAFVKALIMYEGATAWVKEDWIPNEEQKFCYDNPAQQVLEELVIIISNSEYQNRSHVLTSNPQPELEVKDQCGITGTAIGTYHHSFPDYYQTYDAVTTAHILWEEDPDFFFGCNCRTFFPTGGIDWTWHYATDTCSDSDAGHVEAGQGLPLRTDQILILWADPNDDQQYFYSGNGRMFVDAFINCDGGWKIAVQDFFDIPAPDLNFPTPTLPATAPVQAAPTPFCGAAPFTVARDATSISGSCYSGYQYDPYDFVKYEWSFKLAGAAP